MTGSTGQKRCKTAASASASASAPARSVSHLATEQEQQIRLAGHRLACLCLCFLDSDSGIISQSRPPRLSKAGSGYALQDEWWNGALMPSISASTVLSCTTDGSRTVAFNIWQDYQLATEKRDASGKTSWAEHESQIHGSFLPQQC
jgi:hypothetical protein